MASRATAPEPAIVPAEELGDDAHSGRLLLRMPQSLHGELARAAEREHVSLNAYIIAALSGTVRWRADDGGGAERPSGAMPRLLRAAIIADLVLVAVAACVAVVLLIAAL
jgi:hypothetical protein